ncbi:putative leader peptide [Streptomyces sp. 7R007]
MRCPAPAPGRVSTAARRASRTPGPTPLLTSRRHIDLLRVCSAIDPLR